MTQGASVNGMKVGIVLRTTEGGPQGTTPTFHAIAELAQTAERAGLDSIWLPDHLLFRASSRGEVFWEAFTMLSALAAVTKRITLGTIVVSTSFRPPALVAKIAATLDAISEGRLILGLGAGWYQPEYEAFGYPFAIILPAASRRRCRSSCCCCVMARSISRGSIIRSTIVCCVRAGRRAMVRCS